MFLRKTACAAGLALLTLLNVPAHAADAASPSTARANKTLHLFLSTSETGLDPAVASDLASLNLMENIFDPLLRYDYLARPVQLQGNTARAMPTVEDGGRTYTFHLQPGIFFTPDPAFKGQPREVTAQDYVYSLTRLYDPSLKSPWLFLLEDKLVGDAALKTKFSYDTPIAGLQAMDKYTLRIRLNSVDPNFLFYLAMPATAVVAREVAEAYPAAGQIGNHPVGTGPFLVKEWKRSDKIVLQANPTFRATVFHTEAKALAALPVDARAIATALEGQRLPLVERIEVRIVEEYQSRMLGFLKGEFDYLEQVPESMTDMVLENGALKPALAAKGLQLTRFPVLQTYYMWMNMDDPVLGGMSKDKLALRRAIALSYNGREDIALLKKGLALSAQSPLPPNVLGYDKQYRSPVGYDPALARALLDRFGYKAGADGFRTQPDGTPLLLTMHTEPSTVGRLRDELWRRNLNAIGVRVEFKSDKKTEIIKASRLGKVQMFETNWIADFPDGDNFMQLLYGGNVGRANYARFNLPDYNKRYEEARLLSDTPRRRSLYFDLFQLIHAYTPWVLLTHPISADLQQPWLKNYRRHPVEFTSWRYLDVDKTRASPAGK
ncbi:ABC transporter substrate-binding protein [Janthinobacterium sp. SUN137]|uniref:ABC transporter substrate-binding protein n=1 Tax=Janthinobacterium sp. SUN137 TaxID=3014789 RepID=UPI002712F0FA|nr:ABC transporter substrate-binding protein [Janthinobacterium sp. SUN137]MDO8042882.1 ABC transporter substrate-binding protein [Janthinobacterium sp. SUN137]